MSTIYVRSSHYYPTSRHPTVWQVYTDDDSIGFFNALGRYYVEFLMKTYTIKRHE